MKSVSRSTTLAVAAALAGSALLVPSAANAAVILEETTAAPANSTCTVTEGTLSWGVKESFRSYISGSIANGDWEASDGARYETPSFHWEQPVGAIDAVTGEGSVAFAGAVHFRGHDGALDLTLANPTIGFSGDGTAQLLLDTRSQQVNGEIAIDETQAYIGKIEGIGHIDPASGEITLEAASAILTADGATAFSDFYASGDALDPIMLSLRFGPCEGTPPEIAEVPVAVESLPTPAEDTEAQRIPWLPIGIAGIAVLVIGVTGALLIVGRKKAPAEAASAEAASAEAASADSEN